MRALPLCLRNLGPMVRTTRRRRQPVDWLAHAGGSWSQRRRNRQHPPGSSPHRSKGPPHGPEGPTSRPRNGFFEAEGPSSWARTALPGLRARLTVRKADLTGPKGPPHDPEGAFSRPKGPPYGPEGPLSWARKVFRVLRAHFTTGKVEWCWLWRFGGRNTGAGQAVDDFHTRVELLHGWLPPDPVGGFHMFLRSAQ